MMKLKQMIAALISAMLLLSLCACGSTSEAAQPAGDQEPVGIAVQVTTVAKEDVSTAHRVNGTVSDSDAASLYASADAVVEKVYVQAGQEVKAGEKLCRLSSGTMLASFNAADATYLSTVESYFNQKTIFEKQIALYQKLWNDAQQLYNIGAASRLEVQQAELTYLGGISQRDATMAQIEQGLETYKSYQEKRSALTPDADGDIVAPFDGTVSAICLSDGGAVSDQYPVAILSGARQMKVTTFVSEAMMPLLHEGDRVLVKLNAIDAQVDGTIRSVSDSVNQQTRLYTVTIGLPEDTPGLVAGLFADVTFYTDTAISAVAIPSEAILTYNGTEYVYIVENGVANYVEIRSGLVGDGVTQITAGLSGGEKLVTVGQQYLTDGAVVRVVSTEG